MNAFDISMQNIASVLISQLTSTGYKTALQKALTSPCTEYENCGNFCNSNYVYNRVIILPENYGFPLPIGSFIVLTLVNNLVEYLTRPTNRGVGSTSAKVPVRRYWHVKLEVREEQPVPVPLCAAQIPRGLAWVWTRSCLESFAMTSVSHGTSWPLALWLVSQGEGRLSTSELWTIVVNSAPAHPPVNTVQYNFAGP